MTGEEFEALRLSLPVSDPDRHALDTVADERFAALAEGAPVSTAADYPSTCNPVDYAATTAAGYNPPVVWESRPPRTAEVETGGAL